MWPFNKKDQTHLNHIALHGDMIKKNPMIVTEKPKVCHTCGCVIGRGCEQEIPIDGTKVLGKICRYFCKSHLVPYDRISMIQKYHPPHPSQTIYQITQYQQLNMQQQTYGGLGYLYSAEESFYKDIPSTSIRVNVDGTPYKKPKIKGDAKKIRSRKNKP